MAASKKNPNDTGAKIRSLSCTQQKNILNFLNRATAEQIANTIEIPEQRDVGIVTAREIVKYRESKENKRIEKIEELDRVKGIGPARLGQIIDVLKNYNPYIDDVHIPKLEVIEPEEVFEMLKGIAEKAAEDVENIIEESGNIMKHFGKFTDLGTILTSELIEGSEQDRLEWFLFLISAMAAEPVAAQRDCVKEWEALQRATKKLADAQQELREAQQEYDDAEKKLQQALQEVEKAEKGIKGAQEAIDASIEEMWDPWVWPILLEALLYEKVFKMMKEKAERKAENARDAMRLALEKIKLMEKALKEAEKEWDQAFWDWIACILGF